MTTPHDLLTQAKIITARCRAAGRAAVRAQDSDEARHQAGQAQRALEELAELIEDQPSTDELRAFTKEAFELTDNAFDTVCALREVEKKAAKHKATTEPEEQAKLAAELEEDAETPTPRGLLEIAKPHINEARQFMRSVLDDDEEEDSCPECGGVMLCDQSWCMAKRATEPDRVDRMAATQKWDPGHDPYTAGRIVEHKSRSGKTTQRAVIEENVKPGNPRGELICVRLSTTGTLIPQYVYLKKQDATLVPLEGEETK